MSRGNSPKRRRSPPPPAVAGHCTQSGKVRYIARALARASIRTLRARGGTDLHAYRCLNCGDWHVGHTKKAA